MIDLGHLNGRTIAVMGLARSGLTAARALKAAGATLLAWDDGAGGQKAAAEAGIELTNLHDTDFAGIEALVLSPGIPHTYPAPNPIAAKAKAAGVPIISDIELLRRACPKATYVGITGTNGKSTTTALTAHIITGTGRPTQVGGNLGIPALSFLPLDADGVYVLEMSSYQLEITPSLGFEAAVLLNITPDHLDRHGGMEGYIAAKKLIFRKGMAAGAQVAVIGIDDPHCASMAAELDAEFPGKVIRISAEGPVSDGIGVENGILIDDRGGHHHPVTDLRTLATLPGRHNWQNAAAAYALARAVGINHAEILDGLRTFPGLAHRQSLVATIDGVRFVNDSKATNADAAAKALACYQPIYWILGGKAKDTGLDGLDEFMPSVAYAFLIGDATDEFARWLTARGVPHMRCGTMDVAVKEAFAHARLERREHPVVLLSPACASFDQYPNFEVRGDDFTGQVQALSNGEIV